MPQVNEQFDIKHISVSGFCTFERCPFRYFLKNLCNYNLPDQKMLAADYGKCMHCCLPLCYDGSAQKAVELFCALWNNYPYGMDDKIRNPITATKSLIQFTFDRQKSNRIYNPVKLQIPQPKLSDEEISDYEMVFCIDIGGKLPFVGRIDMPIEMKTDGSIWPMDYKTSREVSERLFENSLNCNPQCIGYTLAMSHLTGTLSKGCAFEVIRSSDKNAESQFMPVYVSEFMISEFIAALNRQSENITNCNDQMSWPRKRTGCDPYSLYYIPGYGCEYKKLCAMQNWEDVLPYYRRDKQYKLIELE